MKLTAELRDAGETSRLDVSGVVSSDAHRSRPPFGPSSRPQRVTIARTWSSRSSRPQEPMIAMPTSPQPSSSSTSAAWLSNVVA